MAMQKGSGIATGRIIKEILNAVEVKLKGTLTAAGLREDRAGDSDPVPAYSFGSRDSDPVNNLDPVYTQNFDTTATGTLPDGWTSYGPTGSLSWVVSASNPQTGSNCCICGPIGHGQAAGLVYTSSLDTNAEVSFWWDVASEAGWDELSFLINDVTASTISGTPGYAQFTAVVPPGAVLKWEYLKDGSGTDLPDQGYVDGFEIAPIPWNEGDMYYNTILSMSLHYDLGRDKWLSAESCEIVFGSSVNEADMTPMGSYFTASNGLPFAINQGRVAEYNGTVVSLSYSRIVDAGIVPSFEVVAGGALVTDLPVVAWNQQGVQVDLNGDFDQGQVLAVRNSNVFPQRNHMSGTANGVVRIKWRS